VPWGSLTLSPGTNVRTLRKVFYGTRIVAAFFVVEVGLRCLKLPRLCRLLGLPLGSGPTAHPRRPRYFSSRQVGRHVRAVALVSRRWPAGDTCLRRALVLGVLMRRAEPHLLLGVARDPLGTVRAHAWLEFDGQSIDPLSSDYEPLQTA